MDHSDGPGRGVKAQGIGARVPRKEDARHLAGKGNFVVKTEKKTVVSLIGLARPFPKLKALDMDKVCADVVAAL